jgi:hypothetical protein
MLVQVSPWKTAKTSIRASQTTKRRKRDENKEFPATVSFITTASKRGLQKMKQHSSEFLESMPLMAITSDHQITVIGRSKEPSYDEYTSLKYASRPGSAGSFSPTSQNGKSGASKPQIPAILDAKNDRVYAFQHGNSRLCCWNSLTANGPDEKGSLKVELSHPARSMALLPMHKGIMYGTCKNGSIFIARVVDDSKNGETLSVEYLPSNQKDGSVHVGTLAELPHGQNAVPGTKRKMSDADGNSPVIFYQVFCNGESVQLVSHKVNCERYSKGGRLVMEESLSQHTTSIDLTPSKVSGSKQKLEAVKLLISSSGSAPKAALFYTSLDCRAQTNGSTDKHGTKYCALLSLGSSELSHHPVSLPTETEQCGLITETLLAVGTNDSILVYDLETGSVLHSTDVGPVLGNTSDSWILSTNSKFSTMAILYVNSGTVEAAFSVLSFDDNKKTPSKRLSLASKLASSLTLPRSKDTFVAANDLVVVNDLLQIGDKVDPRSGASMGDSVHKALRALDQAASKMLQDGKGDSILLDTYESCAAGLVDDLKISLPHHNPQDALPSAEKRPNGLKKKLANGVHSCPSKVLPACTPSSLPQSFIDGAVQIVLSFLGQCPKGGSSILGRRVALASMDAGLILNRLIETGKVSAGLHFESANSFEDSKGDHLLESALKSVQLSNKNGKRVYSPVDMVLGMLRRCPDLSERQLVAMLNFMLRWSLPDDIAEVIVETKLLSRHHSYKTLCRNYALLREQYLKKCLKTKNTQVPKDLELLTHKVIIIGTSLVLERILLYAECNEATLRVALAEGLSNSQESIIVAKMLSDILANAPKEVAVGKRVKRNKMKTVCQWIAALCDSFHDDLSEAKASSGENYLRFLLLSVTAATKHSQAIIALREDISRNPLHEDLLVGTDKKPDFESPLTIKRIVGDEELPGYSIDNMVI